MNRIVSVFLQLVVLAAFAPGPALAHGAGGAHVMGKVRALHGSSLSVEAKGGKEQTIALDAGTKFEKGGAPAAATDLQVGDRVVVHARKDGDKLIAEIVKVGERTRTAPSRQGDDGDGKEGTRHDHSTR
jgi:hypothetical protein